MDIFRAEKAGFCMGVELALAKLDTLIRKEPGHTVYTLGAIIHNPQVVKMYADRGVVTLQTADQAPSGSTVVVRAHGIARKVREDLCRRRIKIVDATCPKVMSACHLIEQHTVGERILLLYGEAAHPEVKSLLSYAGGESVVFDGMAHCAQLNLDPDKKYCLAAQTTKDKERFREISDYLQKRQQLDLLILETICDATRQRQQEAIRIAGQVDFVIVAGGYESSNTRCLVAIVRAHGTRALHVETAEELPLEELRNYRRIGLTAGASTPKEVIDQIERVLASMEEITVE